MKKKWTLENDPAWGLGLLHRRLEDLQRASIKNNIAFELYHLHHLKEAEVKAYALFLQAYLERALRGKPFYSLTDAIEEISKRATAIKRRYKKTFLSTTRTNLFSIVKGLLPRNEREELDRDEGGNIIFDEVTNQPRIVITCERALITRDNHQVERKLYPELYPNFTARPHKSTWKTKTFFPQTKNLFGDKFTLQEFSGYVSQLAGVPPLPLDESVKTLIETEEKKPELTSIKELELECFRLLEELGIIIGDPEVLLSLFSERDLADHLERRRMKNGGVNYGKEIKTKTPAPILDKRR